MALVLRVQGCVDIAGVALKVRGGEATKPTSAPRSRARARANVDARLRSRERISANTVDELCHKELEIEVNGINTQVEIH